MKRLFFYTILLLSVCFNSCITFVDTDKDLDVKPKLVLFCYLVPQLDTTIVSLRNSVPLFTSNPKQNEPVVNATVEISENNIKWVKLEFDTAYKYYFITQTDFPIKEGKTYYIRASAPEFKTVSSSCTVPYLRETNFNLVSIDASSYYSYGYMEWNDYLGEDNYYVFCRKEFGEHILFNRNNWGELSLTYDTAYYYSWDLFWDKNSKPCIYSDKGQDGKKMSAFMTIFRQDIIEIVLLQTDINCYLFEKSITDYNPDFQDFMLEPMQLYSNIKNGYGVFGAFVKRDYTFEFEEEE